MVSDKAKISLGISVPLVIILIITLVGIFLGLEKPWENKPEGKSTDDDGDSAIVPPAFIDPGWPDHPSSVKRITTGADLDFLMFTEKMTYQEVIQECSRMRNRDGTPTHPIRVITRQYGVDLFKLLHNKIKSRAVFHVDEKTLYWTDARFDLLSDNPYLLHLSTNETRSSLSYLDRDWCFESRNYRKRIKDGLAKVRELKLRTDNRIITPQAIHVTLMYDPNQERVCLYLLDTDVGINDSTKLTKITGACEARLSPWASLHTAQTKTERTYYFPWIGYNNVTFSRALAQCRSQSRYTLAGLPATNSKILDQTAGLIGKQHARAVWMGGFFNLSSPNPYLVRWADGYVTDSRKASVGIWCEDIVEQIEVLRTKHVKPEHPLILPIVRLKKKPKCLSLYAEDLTWPDRSIFPPLCISDRARIYLRTAVGRTTVLNSPPFFSGLFNTHLRAFDGMQTYPSRGKVQGGTAIVHAHGKSSHIFTSIRDTLPYSYARSFCKLVRSRNETTKGDMLTDHVLDSLYIDEYKLSFNVFQSWLTFIEGYDEITNRIALTTAGYFDFRPRSDTNHYTELIWDSVSGARIADNLHLKFGWCNHLDPIAEVKKAYKEFEDWYHHSDGKLTTGPNRVYVGVEVVPNAPCLRLVFDELYWPGAYSWVPMCEKPKLPNLSRCPTSQVRVGNQSWWRPWDSGSSNSNNGSEKCSRDESSSGPHAETQKRNTTISYLSESLVLISMR